jgi:uncharacterized membrane protein
MTSAMRAVSLGILTAGALLTTVVVSRYLTLDPAVYFPEQRETYTEHTIGLMVHVVGGMIAMLIGPFQFMAPIRRRWPAVHRWMGRIYLAGVASGAIGGLYMAFRAYGGFPAGLGFGTLAGLWFGAGAMAFVRIRQRQIDAHREWMIRSFALTLAAFSLRLAGVVYSALQSAGVTQLEFTDYYVAIAWYCWVPNLLIAEWFINASRNPRARRPLQPSPARS